MLTFLAALRDMTMLSVTVRLLLATLCGGIIGIEREFKRRPAGFRTHILICLGAAITTLTSQYLFLVMHYNTDVARLGAQVVAGIGFIGAGTIIVTRRQRVKGLTTAAGLWASAIVGLALGAGFFEGGVLVTVLIVMAERVFSRLEYFLLRRSPDIYLYMEYTERNCLDEVMRIFRDHHVRMLHLEVTRATGSEKQSANAIFFLRLDRRTDGEALHRDLMAVKGVLSADRL